MILRPPIRHSQKHNNTRYGHFQTNEPARLAERTRSSAESVSRVSRTARASLPAGKPLMAARDALAIGLSAYTVAAAVRLPFVFRVWAAV